MHIGGGGVALVKGLMSTEERKQAQEKYSPRRSAPNDGSPLLGRAGGLVEEPEVVEAGLFFLLHRTATKPRWEKFKNLRGPVWSKGFIVNENEDIASKIEDLL